MAQPEQTCPHCGWPIEATDRFCGNCLKETCVVEAPLGSQESGPACNAPPEERAVLPNRSSPAGPALTASAPPFPEDTGGDCDFELAYNEARMLLKGARSGFDFRVRPRIGARQSCTQVRIRVEFGFQNAIEESVPLGSAGDQEIALPFKTDEEGVDIPAKVYLSYLRSGAPVCFVGSIRWDCFPPDASSRAIENLSIQLNNISADRAARQNIEILKGLEALAPLSRAEQLRRLKLQPVWRPVPLVDVSPPPPPPPSGRVSKLTLTVDGALIHLLSGLHVRLGKSRDSEIVCRKFTRGGEPDVEHSMAISRFHARIELTAGRCVLRDGDGKAHSRCGTCLDGNRIAPAGAVPLEGRGRISLVAPRELNDPYAFHLDAVVHDGAVLRQTGTGEAQAVVDQTKPACIVLRRTDSIRETYAIVWQGCPLWLVDERLCDLTIWRDQNAFGYAKGEERGWLVPGAKLSLASGQVDVRTYEQYGMAAHWWK